MTRRLRQCIALLCAAALTAGGLAPSWAQSGPQDLCAQSDVFFGFFNGIHTTKRQAEDQLGWLHDLYGTQSPKGDTLHYEVMYNYTAGFEDFIETFEQRLQEQEGILLGRYELFFEAVTGASKGGWWEIIARAIPPLAGLLQSLVDWVRAKAVQSLTALAGSPPTATNLAEHRLRIGSAVLEGRKLLLFAHSQGNLFANAAYQHGRSLAGPASIRLVHVAPASPLVNGTHALADKDMVIGALSLVGSIQPFTDVIPGHAERPPGLNGYTDFLGHGLLEVYLNPALTPASRIRSAVDVSLDTLEAPPRRAASGFFTATLIWDGTGDVDLHAFEPDGSHVYYSTRRGSSGNLDIDNMRANGPEHYFASCDANRLKEGRYSLQVANFTGASGRTATMQITSARDGVLGTRSVVLGADTGPFPSVALFNVWVERDPSSGRWSVTLNPTSAGSSP